MKQNQTWILWNVVYRTNHYGHLYFYCLCETYSKFVNGESGDGSPTICKNQNSVRFNLFAIIMGKLSKDAEIAQDLKSHHFA